MRRKVFVEVPEAPGIEKFVLLDRPGIIYINLSYDSARKGVIYIVADRDTTETCENA